VIRINLLPREERPKRRTLPTIQIPRLGTVAPFAALGVIALAVVTAATVQSRQLAKLQGDVAAARAETERYKPQLEKIRDITQKREEVRTRLDIIARLDRDRYYRVQLLDEVSQALPDNMWLSELSELGDRRFKLDGVTFSNFIVARFMEDLESAEHWQEVDLDVTQKGEMEDLEVVKFSLVSNAQPTPVLPTALEAPSPQLSSAQP
jgi:type IV pilus assembly protein PilN